MPIIPKNMHLGEAIILVSKGKLGLGVSLDEDKRIEGLITDGDIRRAMEKWQAEFVNHKVEEIMTRKPKCVLADTKITEIQKIMHTATVNNTVSIIISSLIAPMYVFRESVAIIVHPVEGILA